MTRSVLIQYPENKIVETCIIWWVKPTVINTPSAKRLDGYIIFPFLVLKASCRLTWSAGFYMTEELLNVGGANPEAVHRELKTGHV